MGFYRRELTVDYVGPFCGFGGYDSLSKALRGFAGFYRVLRVLQGPRTRGFIGFE